MSNYALGPLNIWTYSDNRSLVWFSNTERGHPCENRHLTYERGRGGSIGLNLTVGGEEREIRLRISLLFATLYIGITDLCPKPNPEKLEAAARASRQCKYELDYTDGGRSTGFEIDFGREHGRIELELWENGMVWSRDAKPFKNFPYCLGWSKRWYWRDMLGGQIYEVDKSTETEHDVTVSMSEGDYPATVKTHLVCTGFKFMPKYIWRSEITINDDGAVPSPGKGENGWDCGRNDTQSITFGGTKERYTAETVAVMMAKSVQETRDKRGWDDSMLDDAA